ncbi:MAG: HDIG domain-containing protein [Desulfobacter sp.]|nr:HDIG domain-containing protein [Desulfobacter sp.]WDP86549.1 MAG: HDIG domain-containing protein [Desulfobacter sp.]
MNLPTEKQCFKIIRKMEMMEHIVDHSVMVSNVAVCLCHSIRGTNCVINIDLVKSSALLHDITKTRSFDTGEIHSDTGAALMIQMGYPEIGEIIRQHVMLDPTPTTAPILPEEIVNYADKRVLHDQVVSLDKRLAYIKIKYGKKPEFGPKIQEMWENTLALETKLFKKINFSPAELSGKVMPVVKKSANPPRKTEQF